VHNHKNDFYCIITILEHERGEEDGKSFEIKNECAQSFSSYVLCFPSWLRALKCHTVIMRQEIQKNEKLKKKNKTKGIVELNDNTWVGIINHDKLLNVQ
jgi:hypothetical protein